MNANDMVKRGWKTRHFVDIVSHFNDEERRSDGWQVWLMIYQATLPPTSLKQMC